MTQIIFQPSEVKKAIKRLQANSSPGEDGIGSNILHQYQNQIINPLTMIFNNSLRTRLPLENPYISKMIPIPKPAKPKQLKESHRGISLTSIIVKLMERTVQERLKSHIKKNKMMDKTQFGFVESRSCQQNVLHLINFIIANCSNNVGVTTVYTDMKKAFDQVQHPILIKKLKEQFNVAGDVLKWIHDFLSNRQQITTVEGCESETKPVISGVCQGSTNGPEYYNIHMSDLQLEGATTSADDPKMDKAQLSKFADDQNLAHRIDSETEETMKEDEDELQRHLDSLFKWSEKNKSEFNPTKFQMIHYTLENSAASKKIPHLVIKTNDGKEIEAVEEVLHLGTYMNQHLNWQTNIQHIKIKTWRAIHLILRTFRLFASHI